MKKIYFVIMLTAFVTMNAEVKFPDPYQDAILEYIRPFLPESPIIIEAGGHFGEDTIRMKNVWPTASMHVFEPLPSSYKQMQENVKGLSDVHIYPFALNTYTGTTHFYIDIPNNGASSINFPVEWNQDEFDKTPIDVPCITLDEFSDVYSVSNVDFMWLDMEGHELYALQNGLKILKNVKVIFTEISFVPVRMGSNLYVDLRSFLESNGFEEVWASCHEGRYGDALFVRKSLLNK